MKKPKKTTKRRRVAKAPSLAFEDFDLKDSEELIKLRSAIDDHLGWRNEKEREHGDYLQRIRQVGALMMAMRGIVGTL